MDEDITAGSLLAGLLPYFSDGGENVATAALVHILDAYPRLREAFVIWVAPFPTADQIRLLRVAGQARVSLGIQPDICFKRETNGVEVILLVEVKFSAGLTPQQPVEYVKSLCRNEPSGLVFICPDSRMTELKFMCVKRCVHEWPDWNVNAEGKISVGNSFISFRGWRETIRHLNQIAKENHDMAAVTDLSQLEGLRIAMEGSAIEPFSHSELAALQKLGPRFVQLTNIPAKVAREIVDRGLFRASRSSEAGVRGYDLTSKTAGQWLGWLLFDPIWWAETGLSPLRLRVDFAWGFYNDKSPEVRNKITSAMANTGVAVVADSPTSLSIPLSLDADLAEGDLIRCLADQGNRSLLPIKSCALVTLALLRQLLD
jgi:hypothetical protein